MADLPVRKPNRLKNYDYSQNGAYFVTICVKGKHEMLGKIVGDAALGVPKVELTEIGIIVKQHIENTTHANVVQYVIMPNHIHMIVTIDLSNKNRVIMARRGTPRAASPTKSTIPKTVNAIKGLTTKQIGFSIWQRSYHDHIIRNEADYRRIAEYIENNPAKWEQDCFYKGDQDQPCQSSPTPLRE